MRKLKRILCVLCVLALCVCLLPVTKVQAAGGLTLAQLQAKFPQNKYWNGGNEDSVTDNPCQCYHKLSHKKGNPNMPCTCNQFDGASQCYGFALKLGNDAFNSNPRQWRQTTDPNDVDSLKPGDIIDNSGDGSDNDPYHTVFVIEVTPTAVKVGECNKGGACKIRWDRYIEKSVIKGYTSLKILVAPATLSAETSSSNHQTSYNWNCYLWCTPSVIPNDPNINNEVSSVSVGEPFWFWYRICDANTGVYLDDVLDADYTVSMAIYDPSGNCVQACQYQDSCDWIGTVPQTAGTYSCVVSISGAFSGSGVYQFQVEPGQARDNRWSFWCTKNESPNSIRVNKVAMGDKLYFHYKMFDLNTGDLFNSYASVGYTVTANVYTFSYNNRRLIGTAEISNSDQNTFILNAGNLEKGPYYIDCMIKMDGGATTRATLNFAVTDISATFFSTVPGFVLPDANISDDDSVTIVMDEDDGSAVPGDVSMQVVSITQENELSEGNAQPDASADPNPTEARFTDISASDYYYDAVYWAVENGVTNGIGGNKFGPMVDCTRAQAVTFLWRAAGSPAPKTTTIPFSDVFEQDYYYKAVLWAVENGITRGSSKTTFSPNSTVTRTQVVTFLYRLAGSPDVTGTASFTDVAKNAYYANAVQWAVTNGITHGTGKKTFSPDLNCNRSQIVTFLHRHFVRT